MDKPQFKVSQPYMEYTEMVDYVYQKYNCEKLAPKHKFWKFMLEHGFHNDISNPCFRGLHLGEILEIFADGCDDPAECWEAQILSRMIREFGSEEINVQISW